MQTAKAVVSLPISGLAWALISWHCNEYLYQIDCAGSFDLFFVTSYNLLSLIWNQRINKMQLHKNDHIPMWHA